MTQPDEQSLPEGGVTRDVRLGAHAQVHVRTASPRDYDDIVAVVDDWWGRPVAAGLPRLFLDHFCRTSRVAEDQQGLAGFLVAFVSPARPAVTYVHFVGVRPDLRRTGLARALYDEAELEARRHGARELRAITAPGNTASIRFHERLGFTVSEVAEDHNGPGRAMVTFRRDLDQSRTVQ